MPMTPEEMEASMIRTMKEKTGKALPEWIRIAKKSGIEKHGEIVKHLKSEHGVTHGFANLIAHKARAEGQAPVADTDLVAAQYAGDKAALKPIYDRLISAVKEFGKDVEISPKKTYVSLRRSKQFALIQPSTRTRLDVGIQLRGEPPVGRLEKSGSFNAMVSHRVRISDAKEVDKELIGWLERAYAQA